MPSTAIPPSATVTSTRRRIAVIGAGVSGLACANSLRQRGFDVQVFDKGRRPGGRTSTRQVELGDSEVGFDHGAQYFTVRSPESAVHLAKWEASGVVKRWKGRVVAIDEEGGRTRSNPNVRFVGTPGMSALCAHLAAGLRVRCGVTVSDLRQLPHGFELFESDAKSLGPFDVLVVTAPPAQTAALLTEVAPELADRAASVRMKPCWAVMAAFDEPIAAPFDGAFINRGPLSWVARTSSKPDRANRPDRWVLHANPAWSAAHLEVSREAVVEPLLRAYFDASALPMRQPIWVKAHRWRFALAENPLDEGCLVDASTRIVACGDWANGNRVEGAFLSGRIAARQIEEAHP